MADDNARLQAELDATKQRLAQSEAALQASRDFKAETAPSVGVPVENTPLVPPAPAPPGRQASVVAMGKAVNENKVASGAGCQTCLSFGFAIACLLIFYLNGGDSVDCSTKLPLFLKVNGYASIAYLLATAVVVAVSTKGKQAVSEQPSSFKCLAALVSMLGCFLFVWLICGLVWYFKTSSNDCDPGLYEGSKWFFIVSLVVPLAFACCMCCCLACLLPFRAQEGAGGFQNVYP